MDTRNPRFNRNLLIVLIVLYVLTLAAFSVANWSDDPGDNNLGRLLLNLPILSIPLVLLFGSVYVLAVGWREHAAGKPINPRLAKTIHWAPRIAAILIIFFLSLFSLDVFEMDATPLELFVGFLIHNIPSIALLVLLIFAWRRPVVGFVAFLLAALLFLVFFVRSLDALPDLLLFVLPILLVAGLFYADWRWLKPASPSQLDPA